MVALCAKCGKEHDGSIGSGKFCSRRCANSRIRTEEIRKKVSNRLKGRKVGFALTEPCKREDITKSCVVCGTKFKVRPYRRQQKSCGKKDCKHQLISLSCTGKTGGYRVKSGMSKFHGAYYKGVWMDSSWELKCAKILDAHHVNWERQEKFFKYFTREGKERKYYPDFYLPQKELYIELKGYWTEEIRHKIKSVLELNRIKLLIVDKEEDIDKITYLIECFVRV